MTSLSAFLTCVKYGEIRMVKLLLDHDRSSSIVNINGEENGPNPLKLAYDNGKMLMFHFLGIVKGVYMNCIHLCSLSVYVCAWFMHMSMYE